MLCLLIFTLTAICRGQQNENSPYSRLGIGELSDLNFNNSRQMGGLGASWLDAYHINIVNPASLSFLNATAFDVGVFAKYNNIVESNKNSGIWTGNIEYISLGFPLKNPINELYDGSKSKTKLGMAFTLMPHSSVSYNILSSTTETGSGLVERNYIGQGGSYKFLWSNSIKHKDLSFGVNAGYMFGNISYERNVNFADLPFAYDNRFSASYTLNGFLWSAGLIYTKVLNEKAIAKNKLAPAKRISLGIHGNSTTGFSTNSSIFESAVQTLIGATNRDTIRQVDDVEGKGKLPAEIGAGLTYFNGEKYAFGINYTLTAWSAYFNDANQEKAGDMLDAFKLAAGGYYRPNYKSFDNFFERIYYRYGVFYQADPRQIQGEQITGYGVSLGLGMPFVFQRKVSNVNLGVIAGLRGQQLPVSEKYFKISFGVTFNDDEWFLKRKYN